MAHLLIYAPRRGPSGFPTAPQLHLLQDALSGPGTSAAPPLSRCVGGVLVAVLFPPSALGSIGDPCRIGATYVTISNAPARPAEHKPEPDLCVSVRAAGVSVANDRTASRTLWCLHDGERFIASTSQRLIVALSARFDINLDACHWMLSSGSLGPMNSWDRRISMLPPDSVLSFDVRSWTLDVRTRIGRWSVVARGDEEHLTGLRAVIASELADHRLDDRAVVALSGGVDSWGLVHFLAQNDANRRRLRCVNLGKPGARADRRTDAAVAQEHCAELGIPLEYLVVDPLSVSFDESFSSFVRLGEGRIDHYESYSNNFGIWTTLARRGVATLYRGGQGFGFRACRVGGEREMLVRLGAGRFVDFDELVDRGGVRDIEQPLPPSLQRRRDESLATWRDRLYHEFRLPVVLAALTQCKSAFLDVVSPYLSSSIIDYVRTMPDELRTDKFAYRRIIARELPHFRAATKNPLVDLKDVLSSERALASLVERVYALRAGDVAPRALVDFALRRSRLSEAVRASSRRGARRGGGNGGPIRRLICPSCA